LYKVSGSILSEENIIKITVYDLIIDHFTAHSLAYYLALCNILHLSAHKQPNPNLDDK
jgi:hypothetical protein